MAANANERLLLWTMLASLLLVYRSPTLLWSSSTVLNSDWIEEQYSYGPRLPHPVDTLGLSIIIIKAASQPLLQADKYPLRIMLHRLCHDDDVDVASFKEATWIVNAIGNYVESLMVMLTRRVMHIWHGGLCMRMWEHKFQLIQFWLDICGLRFWFYLAYTSTEL